MKSRAIHRKHFPRLHFVWAPVGLLSVVVVGSLVWNFFPRHGRSPLFKGSANSASTTELILDPQFRDAALDKDSTYLLYLASICPPRTQGKRIVLDVGGNKGYSLPRYGFLWGNLDHAMVLHHVQNLIPKTNMWREDHGLEVHVFEPSSSAYSVLSALKDSLPFYRLFLHHMAVSSEEGFAELIIPHDNVGDEGGAIAVEGKIPGLPVHSKEIINVTTLDRFYSKTFHDNELIEYIKIDVEGFESHVIRGMEQILSRKLVKAFEFEYGPAWYDGRTGIPEGLKITVNRLYEKDYLCYFIVSIDGIFKFIHIRPVPWEDAFDSLSRCNVFCINSALSCFHAFDYVASIRR